jgi:hypothetical protein
VAGALSVIRYAKIHGTKHRSPHPRLGEFETRAAKRLLQYYQG